MVDFSILLLSQYFQILNESNDVLTHVVQVMSLKSTYMYILYTQVVAVLDIHRIWSR